MAIIKLAKRHQWVIFSVGILQNKKLSWKAKGLYAYLMSRPPDWQVYVKQLATVSKDKRDSVYGAIRELIKHGYIVRRVVRNRGKYAQVVFTVYEKTRNAQ